mgnify:CR=1 FL=1
MCNIEIREHILIGGGANGFEKPYKHKSLFKRMASGFVLILVVILASACYVYIRSKISPKLKKEYPYYTYVLKCREGGILGEVNYYRGHTDNFYKRYKAHKNKEVPVTRHYTIITPYYVEGHQTKEQAHHMEMRMKDWSRQYLEKYCEEEKKSWNLLRK